MSNSKIRLLPERLINQIAAGEVIEKPSSVIKELVENSIDAGATKIDVIVKDGGKSYISITDNGTGMSKEELELAVQRHATSKLPSDDLLNIHSFGFRGEAIPSIASVSKMSIATNNNKEAWGLEINGGVKSDPKPVSISKGTKIEIKDLFYATPARLKFLKTERSELSAIIDVIQSLALSHPDISFTFNEKTKYITENALALTEDVLLLNRISDILGKEFKPNSLKIDLKREDVSLKGFISKPTYNKANSLSQYVFVNGRPVKDKLLQTAIRVGYMDVLERGRFPAVVLFIDLPSEKVDVNVHPTKSEVRFREAGFIRGLIISSIKSTIAFSKAAPSVIDINDIIKDKNTISPFDGTSANKTPTDFGVRENSDNSFVNENDFSHNLSFIGNDDFAVKGKDFYSDSQNKVVSEDDLSYPLGIARGQIHNTYIIAQTNDGLILVDQHACHERIVYEKLKEEFLGDGVKRQLLLIPEVVELDQKQLLKISDIKDDLSNFGLVIEDFGKTAVVVRETPAILGEIDIQNLVKDVAEQSFEFDSATKLEEKLNHFIKTYACHTSIRAGKTLTFDEMDSLLRQTEKTLNSGQCNHGRPTYVKLRLKDIEKLFDRT